MGITPWAIVGGTGQFANAHGTIKLGIFRETNVETYVQLDIHVFSTPETVSTKLGPCGPSHILFLFTHTSHQDHDQVLR